MFKDPKSMNAKDIEREPVFQERASDWRNGAIVYQVLVDRFVPPQNPSEKSTRYAPPRVFKKWDELPKAGGYNLENKVWTHEIEFWGGDLKGVQSKLNYIKNLGADILYLNPIFLSYTNHKYDTWDYHEIDPGYGTREDLSELTRRAHQCGMRVILDGVFNHMGRQSPMVREALSRSENKWHDFFKFDERSRYGYIAWSDVENLPELNLENEMVQDYIFGAKNSVVQSYLLNENIDGWRLDVAYDMGFSLLSKLTKAAKSAKPDCEIIGEIWNYPEEWSPAVDGVMNMHGRNIILHMVQGKIHPAVAAKMWETMIRDSGIDPILKSWLVLDNHDTPRLRSALPNLWASKMARVLQLTLPGSPCIYYGAEVGLTGGNDPEMRNPMKWDLVTDSNECYLFHKKLLSIRKSEPALRYGDFRLMNAQNLFAFLRRTNSISEIIIVVANPFKKDITEYLQVRESKIPNGTTFIDLLTEEKFSIHSGLLEMKTPAQTVRILKPDLSESPQGYSRFDRVY
ncbi:MAG: alpha-glucosidase C-terminal domain-containing protein [Candidatus Riflebacteria bacterium]|nr:alpha-glucosidase C-terminal domain-containing protein [Candidatus Riflebacteria bacterium]